MGSTVIENYEPDDEGWGIVIGPLITQRPTTPSEEQREEEPSDEEQVSLRCCYPSRIICGNANDRGWLGHPARPRPCRLR